MIQAQYGESREAWRCWVMMSFVAGAGRLTSLMVLQRRGAEAGLDMEEDRLRQREAVVRS